MELAGKCSQIFFSESEGIECLSVSLSHFQFISHPLVKEAPKSHYEIPTQKGPGAHRLRPLAGHISTLEPLKFLKISKRRMALLVTSFFSPRTSWPPSYPLPRPQFSNYFLDRVDQTYARQAYKNCVLPPTPGHTHSAHGPAHPATDKHWKVQSSVIPNSPNLETN